MAALNVQRILQHPNIPEQQPLEGGSASRRGTRKIPAAFGEEEQLGILRGGRREARGKVDAGDARRKPHQNKMPVWLSQSAGSEKSILLSNIPAKLCGKVMPFQQHRGAAGLEGKKKKLPNIFQSEKHSYNSLILKKSCSKYPLFHPCSHSFLLFMGK